MDSQLVEFLRSKVPDWDDDVVSTARFKAFSGQRCDWEARFQFWRRLVIDVSRHLGRIIIDSDEVKTKWFVRQGLIPLCLEEVLLEMYRCGDLAKQGDLEEHSGQRFQFLFKWITTLVGMPASNVPNRMEGKLILVPLLEEKLDQVLSSLKEMHWSNVCIITIKKFEGLCGRSEEASVLLAYLLRRRRAQRLVINTRNCIEGIKILLEPSEAITNVSQLDLNILHLHWTLDMLHKQLSIAEKRYDMSKDLAIKEAKSGHRQIALKHLHNLKLAVNSKTKLQGFVDKVEEVLRIISDLDSAKKVSDAIKLGAKTIKEHAISIEEVCECMEDLDETVASHKQIEDTLQSLPSVEIEEGELEAELANLELELEPVDEPEHIPIKKPESPSASIKHLESHQKVEHLVQKLSKMELEPAEAAHA